MTTKQEFEHVNREGLIRRFLTIGDVPTTLYLQTAPGQWTKLTETKRETS